MSPAPLGPGTLSRFFDKWGQGEFLSFHALLPRADEETARLFPPTPNGPVLMLGVSEGRHLPIDITALVPGIERIISTIQADLIFFACAGDFPQFSCPVPIVQPARAIRRNVVGRLRPGARLGVITPGMEQVFHVRQSWQKVLNEAFMDEIPLKVDWSPPERASLEACAARLAEWGAEYIAVECLGFGSSLGGEIARLTGARVILALDVAVCEIEGFLK